MTTLESLSHLKVCDVMTRDVVSAMADESIHEVAQSMAENELSAIPVVNHLNQCIGIISRSDLTEMFLEEDQVLSGLLDADRMSVAWLSQSTEAGTLRKVKELMQDQLVTIGADSSVVQACRVMADHQIHHLLVTGDDRELLGIVSTFDIVRLIGQAAKG